MFADIFEDIFQPMFSDLFGLSKVCQAIRFNGVNNYGQLATRAIDPDGDIDIEFWTPSDVSGGADKYIIGQSLTNTVAAREFGLFIAISGNLGIIVGGAITAAALAGTFGANELLRLVYTGSTLSVFKADGSLLRTASFTRGAAREPDAPTVIGARTVGTAGVMGTYSQGLIPYIRINNFYYAMDAVGQAIQPSLPAGNDMTLFNTVPEQWEEISCGLRPSEDELLTPTITSEPQDQSVLVGETASFAVAAEVELGAVEFQWQADSGAGFVDIPTETSATLSLPLVALIDNGKLVRARVSANGRSAVSRAALLTVGEPI